MKELLHALAGGGALNHARQLHRAQGECLIRQKDISRHPAKLRRKLAAQGMQACDQTILKMVVG